MLPKPDKNSKHSNAYLLIICVFVSQRINVYSVWKNVATTKTIQENQIKSFPLVCRECVRLLFAQRFIQRHNIPTESVVDADHSNSLFET